MGIRKISGQTTEDTVPYSCKCAVNEMRAIAVCTIQHIEIMMSVDL